VSPRERFSYFTLIFNYEEVQQNYNWWRQNQITTLKIVAKNVHVVVKYLSKRMAYFNINDDFMVKLSSILCNYLIYFEN